MLHSDASNHFMLRSIYFVIKICRLMYVRTCVINIFLVTQLTGTPHQSWKTRPSTTSARPPSSDVASFWVGHLLPPNIPFLHRIPITSASWPVLSTLLHFSPSGSTTNSSHCHRRSVGALQLKKNSYVPILRIQLYDQQTALFFNWFQPHRHWESHSSKQ